MAESLIKNHKDGRISNRYRKMAVNAEEKRGSDLATDLVEKSLGLPRVSAVVGVKPDLKDQMGCKYFYEGPDPNDSRCSWYAVRLPVRRTPGVVYFNPMVNPPSFPKHQVKLVKWFQLPQTHLGMVMGRISMSVQPIPA
jgi:hypothetical protein